MYVCVCVPAGFSWGKKDMPTVNLFDDADNEKGPKSSSSSDEKPKMVMFYVINIYSNKH